MDAASRDDALIRLRESLLANAEVARALGLGAGQALVGQPLLEGPLAAQGADRSLGG